MWQFSGDRFVNFCQKCYCWIWCLVTARCNWRKEMLKFMLVTLIWSDSESMNMLLMILHVMRKAEDFVPYLVECHLTQAAWAWAVVFRIFRWLMVLYLNSVISEILLTVRSVTQTVSWSMLQASLACFMKHAASFISYTCQSATGASEGNATSCPITAWWHLKK